MANLIKHENAVEVKKCDRCKRPIKLGSLYAHELDVDYGPECVAYVERGKQLFSDPELVREWVQDQYKQIIAWKTREGMARRKAQLLEQAKLTDA